MKIAKHTGKRGEKNPSAIRAGKTGSHKNPGKWMANGFLLPSILGVLLFFVLPFFIVIYYFIYFLQTINKISIMKIYIFDILKDINKSTGLYHHKSL